MDILKKKKLTYSTPYACRHRHHRNRITQSYACLTYQNFCEPGNLSWENEQHIDIFYSFHYHAQFAFSFFSKWNPYRVDWKTNVLYDQPYIQKYNRRISFQLQPHMCISLPFNIYPTTTKQHTTTTNSVEIRNSKHVAFLLAYIIRSVVVSLCVCMCL